MMVDCGSAIVEVDIEGTEIDLQEGWGAWGLGAMTERDWSRLLRLLRGSCALRRGGVTGEMCAKVYTIRFSIQRTVTKRDQMKRHVCKTTTLCVDLVCV